MPSSKPGQVKISPILSESLYQRLNYFLAETGQKQYFVVSEALIEYLDRYERKVFLSGGKKREKEGKKGEKKLEF